MATLATQSLTHSIPEPPSKGCLVRRQPELVAMLIGMGFSPEDAADSAQEAVVCGLRILDAGHADDIMNRSAWLRSVAIRNARKILRRRRQRQLPAFAVPEINPFSEMEQREEETHRLICLRAAVAKLPDALRELLVFCAIEGQTYVAASRHFGLAVGVVSKRLNQARQLLRSTLRQQGFDVPE